MGAGVVRLAWLQPMFDDRPPIFGLPAGLVVLIAGAVGCTIGVLWMRHLFRPDELTRGEARWRYRDRGPVDRLDDALLDISLPRRTRGWWATRLEFAAAIAMIAVAVAVLAWASANLENGMRGFDPVSIQTVAGFGGMLFGLGWMIRIYRAPGEGARTASWRYRDRR